MVIDELIGVRTALQRGLNQLFIPVQRQAEQLNEENRNDTEKGKSTNRRTQIIITPKLDQFMELIGQAPKE